jgi:hypothetical protein
MAIVDNPKTAAADQRKPGAQHALGQQTEDQYFIHDMAKGPRVGIQALTKDVQDVMKMLDDLDDLASEHQSSSMSGPETISSSTVVRTLPDGAEKRRVNGRSCSMRTRAEHHNKELAGLDDKGVVEADGAVDDEEDMWSNMASAGSRDHDTEEKIPG